MAASTGNETAVELLVQAGFEASQTEEGATGPVAVCFIELGNSTWNTGAALLLLLALLA